MSRRPGEASYERHEPERTLLHRVVREELETFLARASARGQPPPRFVEQELRAYLRCGILAHGFLRLRCDDCRHERLVAFSCKRRGFCPSCGGRRMADTAAHLVDRVLPEVPIRQWVLTLPYPLRFRCAYGTRLTSDVLRAFTRALFAELRRRAMRRWGARGSQCGAVTFIQRFAAELRSACASHAPRARGSAMNLNLHFHTLVLDGVYSGSVFDREPPRFSPLPAPSAEEVARVLAGTARRIHRLIERRAGDDEDALARDEPLLALLAAASLQTRIATGPEAGMPWRRLGDRVEPAESGGTPGDSDASPRVPRYGGMSLHADVCVPARDRARLERLCRYVARPPLAQERLEERSDGSLALRLKTRWRDGTTHILMEQRELIERLVPLIPPPRANQVRYHGILAPAAGLRDRVTPRASEEAGVIAPPEDVTADEPGDEPNAGHAERTRAYRIRWAKLLMRVFEIAGQLRWPSACESKIHRDALRCPQCGATLRLLAAIEDPEVASKILACLDLPARAPPTLPAKPGAVRVEGDLTDDEDFDQTPAFADPL